MSSIVELVQRVMDSGVLTPELCTIPDEGASEDAIAEVERRIGVPLPSGLRQLLHKWNGLDLEVIRIFGVGEAKDGIIELTGFMLNQGRFKESVWFASDPAGYAFGIRSDGAVLLWDHDGVGLEQLARSFDEFFTEYLFGRRASEFGGDSWLRELNAAGILG